MKLKRLTEYFRFFLLRFDFYLDPIPVTPEPALKRPTHLDLMPVINFTPKKSPNVSWSMTFRFFSIFCGYNPLTRLFSIGL